VNENLIALYGNQQTLCGRGSFARLLPLLAEMPQPVLLFCGQSFLNSATWNQYGEALRDHILAIEIVSHEASPDEIDTWVERWRGQVARVVAIGGGSVLDAAKAFAAMVQHPLPTARYLEKIGDTPVNAVTLPLIAVPTTAGTGSEVTQNAVVTDQKNFNVKASLRHPAFVPQIAILDADLLRGTPDTILATCAIDAFTHLFEAYLSKKGNFFTRQMALQGLQLFFQAWPRLNQADQQGDDAREAMLIASWLGGLCLSSAGLGVIHGIAGELGAIKAFHHGEVCGRLLLPFLDLLAESPHAEQQHLMSRFASQLLPDTSAPAALALKEWLQQHAIVPFWLAGPTLSVSEAEWIVMRSGSKNSWIEYDSDQRMLLLASAWRVV